MTLVESTEEDDEVVEFEGLKFVLSSKMNKYLKDAKIDYKNSFLGGGFSITGGKQVQGSC